MLKWYYVLMLASVCLPVNMKKNTPDHEYFTTHLFTYIYLVKPCELIYSLHGFMCRSEVIDCNN